MVTVPVVVGFQVTEKVVPAGTASLSPGCAIGLQASVHIVVGVVYADTRDATAAAIEKYFASILSDWLYYSINSG